MTGAESKMAQLDVTIIGGGMIVHDLILPVVYHLRRTGLVKAIKICATHSASLKILAQDAEIKQAFPGQTFLSYPGLDEPEENVYPDLYKDVIAGMDPRNIVVVAVPDQLHFPVVNVALDHDQHVLCVKPLVLEYAQAKALEQRALEKGLFIGVEYHKRFDRRALLARRHYEQGQFGELIIGEAKLIEPYYYRHSNFQNWFTKDKTDPFVYVGCHYVDLVQFITNLKPVEVTVHGIERPFPNGKIAYMWSVGIVRYENGALLSVTNGLGYPDDGAGSNEQCLSMYFEGSPGIYKTGHLKHNDQFRGVEYSFLEKIGPGGSYFNYVNPDFFRLVPWEGPGYKPIGYGADSVSGILSAAARIEQETNNLDETSALARRRELIQEIDAKNLLATPANSSTNELVMEAARLSILHGGQRVKIIYGESPRVELV